jgi:TonB family protein
MILVSKQVCAQISALLLLGCVAAGSAAGQEAAPATSPAPPSVTSDAPASQPAQSGGITEDELKQMLVGKTFFLRGGYLDGSLNFNEHGGLIGRSPVGSYTLCMVEIDRVRLTKHKVELDGVRYGMHFLGALPYEDPTKAVDRVRITPKKKELRITIDRELVVKPKKQKPGKNAAAKPAAVTPAQAKAIDPAPAACSSSAGEAATSATAAKSVSEQKPDTTDADELKKELAATPAAERPADPASQTTTTSPAHAAKVLQDALQNVFATELDERMMAAMPDFWKLYYQAAAAKTDYQPSDPAVMRQATVDRKARLLTNFQPESNEYAQDAEIAGPALYHAVIGADGKPSEIAVARPIGFGLDENAVSAIRNAKFDPAMKDGKPVPVLLDLTVEFRIYSNRTAAARAPAEQADKPATASLPGPYSVQQQPQ